MDKNGLIDHASARSASLPRLDTTVINVESLGVISFPKVNHANGHPRYNFDYSWRTISERLIVMNDLISRLEDSFSRLHKHVKLVPIRDRDPLIFRRYLMNGEILVNSLKTTADHLLSIHSIFESRLRKGVYGKKIVRDSIGRYIDDRNIRGDHFHFLYKHAPMLGELNDASNGFKHSFLNLHVGTYESEPSVLVYYLPSNDLAKQGSPCTVQFSRVLPEYNNFLVDIKSEIVQLIRIINDDIAL